MYMTTEIINNKDIWKFDSHFCFNRSWWNYYSDYKNVVDIIINRIKNDDNLIDTVSLPLLFLIRHSLELGLKLNILTFEKTNTEIKAISLKGMKYHSLENLYNIFIEHLNFIKNKYKLRSEILNQLDGYLKKIIPLKDKLHKLDQGSYNFRYPVDTEGNHNFSLEASENIAEIIDLFYEIQPLLLNTVDVFIDEGIIKD